MNEEIMNDVAMESANQDVVPAEEANELADCETNNVPAMIATVVTICAIMPFMTAFSAVAGVNAADDYFSEESKQKRKLRREERKAKRQARKDARAAKKQKAQVINQDDEVNTDI